MLCAGGGADPVVRIVNLPCSRNQTFCEANVLLARNLELGRVYDLKLRLRDTRGDTTTVRSTIRPTNSSTPIDTIFPHLSVLVIVPEVGSKGKALQTLLFNITLLRNTSNCTARRGAYCAFWSLGGVTFVGKAKCFPSQKTRFEC